MKRQHKFFLAALLLVVLVNLPFEFFRSKSPTQLKVEPGKDLTHDNAHAQTKQSNHSRQARQADEEIRECLGHAADSILTPESDLNWIVKALTEKDAIPVRRVKNLHIELPDGERRRVHLFLDSSLDGKEVLRFRYFAEDAEGLPVPIAIPPEHQTNPDDSILESYTSQGKITFSESSWSAGPLDWTVENDSVTEFHWLGHHKSLGCAVDSGFSNDTHPGTRKANATAIRCRCHQSGE